MFIHIILLSLFAGYFQVVKRDVGVYSYMNLCADIYFQVELCSVIIY